MRFAAKGERPALDIFWYDGGVKPPVPEELVSENRELAEEGMLLIGDKGKILGGFHSENPQLISKERTGPASRADRRGARSGAETAWITAFKGGPASYGDFLRAGPISDAVNLAAISLRLGGRRLLWDSATAKITNIPAANKFLTREYRPGWELKS
jgi:hypothetical protein